MIQLIVDGTEGRTQFSQCLSRFYFLVLFSPNKEVGSIGVRGYLFIDLSQAYLISLCFVSFHRFCSFYKLNFCGKLVSRKLMGTIFPIGLIYLLSLYHILVIFAVFQTFSFLFCWFVMVIHDRWSLMLLL